MNLREINHLIATKVMGWELLKVKNHYGDEVGIWIDPKINKFKAFLEGVKEDEFSPTTNIADAWQVVEKFDFNYLYRSKDFADGKWECKLSRKDERVYYAVAETAPLAICLAALKAVALEVGETK
jgi:Phage ABA sandwich domain